MICTVKSFLQKSLNSHNTIKFQSQACSGMGTTELHAGGYQQAGSEGKASGRHTKVFNSYLI